MFIDFGEMARGCRWVGRYSRMHWGMCGRIEWRGFWYKISPDKKPLSLSYHEAYFQCTPNALQHAQTCGPQTHEPTNHPSLPPVGEWWVPSGNIIYFLCEISPYFLFRLVCAVLLKVKCVCLSPTLHCLWYLESCTLFAKEWHWVA